MASLFAPKHEVTTTIGGKSSTYDSISANFAAFAAIMPKHNRQCSVVSVTAPTVELRCIASQTTTKGCTSNTKATQHLTFDDSGLITKQISVFDDSTTADFFKCFKEAKEL